MKMENKDGSLTEYALSCGYIQLKVLSNGIRTKLMEQHGCYFTTIYDNNKNIRYIDFASGSLAEAKEVYNNAEFLLSLKLA